MQKIGTRKLITAGMLALILTFLQIAGWQISMDYGSSFHQSDFFQKIGVLEPWQCCLLGIIEWSILFLILTYFFLRTEKNQLPQNTVSAAVQKNLFFFHPYQKWLVLFLGLYAIWLFLLWGCYPGFYNYDIGNQLPMVMYEEVPYDAHHPLLHTLFSGGIITLGYKIDSTDLTFGVFLYHSIQMAICALCFSYTLQFLFERTKNLILLISSFIFYAFCPPIVMFVMCPTKDILCYAFLLVAFLQLFRIYEACHSNCTGSLSTWLSAGIFLLLACLIRKNIIYAFVVFAFIALIIFRRAYKQQILLYLGVIISFFLIDKALLIGLNAIPGSINEMFSVPYQQIARLYVEEGPSAFTEEEYNLLSELVPPEALTCYDPTMGDHTKINFYPGLETLLENKGTYIKLWLKKGLEYPEIYLDSFLYNTYQAWYPWTLNIDYTGVRYFDITGWQDEYGRPNLQGLYDYYKGVRFGSYAQYPVLRLLFSTGTMFWAALVAFFYCIWRKQTPAILALLLILLVCATSFLGPVADVRYYLILFYMLPVCISFFLRGGLSDFQS